MTAGTTQRSALGSCPTWCVTEHGQQLGEEDWVHSSQPIRVAGGMELRACTSLDPRTGAEDGPYVLLGESELTADEAQAVGEALLLLARTG